MLPARIWPPWLIWLVLGVVLSAAYPVLPSLAVTAALGGLIGVVSCVLSVAGIRYYRPATSGAWFLIIAGQFLCVGGDFTFMAESMLRDGGMLFPSTADALYLAAFPFVALGLFRLTRDRWLRWSAGLIDSAIIAVSLTIVYWVFVIGPTAVDGSLPVLTRLAQAGYPTTGVLLCAVVTPMVMRRGRTASMTLLTVGSLATLAGNVIYTLLPDLPYATKVAFASFLMAYVCWGAAALHPSVREPAVAPSSDPGPEHLGRSRIVLLAVSMLLVPAVLLIRRAESVQHLGWLAIGLGSAVLTILVVVRLSGFVTMAQRQAGRLQDLAMRDDLTGLANRRSFELAATAALAGGSPHVAVIDLADFKNINDRLGRAAADRALVSVAHRLAATAGAGLVVARINGDEFALLIPDATAAEADAITGRVADSLRRPILADSYELLLNVRIGVTGSDDSVADAGELLRRADTALDAAKKYGSRFRRYTVELDDHAGQAAQIGAELRHALDDAEFRLVYQPIVDLPNGKPLAVEALVRWQHPVRGFVSPADFIPVAEGNGLIIELGAWVMRTACAQAVTWQRDLGSDAPGYVSVNVSAHQLAQPDFAQFVASVLAESGLAGRCLLVEVTETAIFSGGIAMETLEQLRALGVRIALDDFGTGHSSLGLLQNVPVDVLKVDKSFVDNITMSGRHAVIAEALIKVAAGLGLEAVAEGVETAEQADELYRLGYRLVQGYHFGKPVAEPVFPRAADHLPVG
ncbi:MAG TPA: bifunctional diguanylate cyclase/phosphodiesterase [Actinoplanes sp.]|jgi:diguanylate cyclase (GGDEF)-like protein